MNIIYQRLLGYCLLFLIFFCIVFYIFHITMWLLTKVYLTFWHARSTRPYFKEVLMKIEAQEECRNLPMISFLILPMQRVTRLPLLMDVSSAAAADLGIILKCRVIILHTFFESYTLCGYMSSQEIFLLRNQWVYIRCFLPADLFSTHLCGLRSCFTFD